jgi:hypothetical protein
MSSKLPDCFPLTREEALEKAIAMDDVKHLRDRAWYVAKPFTDKLKKTTFDTIGMDNRDFINSALIADMAVPSTNTKEQSNELKRVLFNSFEFCGGIVKVGYSDVVSRMFTFCYDREDLHMIVTFERVSHEFPLYDYDGFVQRMLVRVYVIIKIYPELKAAFVKNDQEPIDENF